MRDHVLEVRFETGDGRLVKGGGPTVKNVTGYDLPAPVRRVARHDRRPAAGDAALPAAAPALRALVRAAPTPAGATGRRPGSGDGDARSRAVRGRRRRRRRTGPRPHRARRPRRRCPTGAHRGRISVAPGTRARRAPRALDRRRAVVRGARRRHVHVAADDARRCSRARAVAHAHGGWMLREAGGAPDDDGYGRPLPNVDVMRRVKDAFDPDGRLNPGRLPLAPGRAGDGDR